MAPAIPRYLCATRYRMRRQPPRLIRLMEETVVFANDSIVKWVQVSRDAAADGTVAFRRHRSPFRFSSPVLLLHSAASVIFACVSVSRVSPQRFVLGPSCQHHRRQRRFVARSPQDTDTPRRKRRRIRRCSFRCAPVYHRRTGSRPG